MKVSTKIADIDKEINKLGIMLQAEQRRGNVLVVTNNPPTCQITGCHVACKKQNIDTYVGKATANLNFIMIVPNNYNNNTLLYDILQNNLIDITSAIENTLPQHINGFDRATFIAGIRTCTRENFHISCLFYINGTTSNISITECEYRMSI